MSMTLYFLDTAGNWVTPWECSCVCRPSSDPIDALYGVKEDCGHVNPELNLANANARSFVVALGMVPAERFVSPSGEAIDAECHQANTFADIEGMMMNPQELHAACGMFLDSEIATLDGIGRASESGAGANGCQWYSCGCDGEQLTRYATRTRDLCEQAMLAGAMKCYFA